MSAYDPTTWITGLMRENYDAVGFIPEPTIRYRYVGQGQYVLQTDERGRRLGYLLHGPLAPGGVCVVTQHVIEADRRLHGYGEAAWQMLLERCRRAGVDTIRLRCASDLPSLEFWRAQGFFVYGSVPGGTHRRREIVKMAYDCGLPLWERRR